MRMFNPPHPGIVLRDYLGSVSVTAAAKHLRITRAALSRILNGSAGISAEMALRLADALGTSPELWIGMQAQYDLWRASQRQHKRVTPFFVGPGHPRLGKSLPGSGGPSSSGKTRVRAAGRS